MQNFILTSIIDIMATSHKCQDKRNLAKCRMIKFLNKKNVCAIEHSFFDKWLQNSILKTTEQKLEK